MNKNKLKIPIAVVSCLCLFAVIWLGRGVRHVSEEEGFIPPVIEKLAEEKKIRITVAVPSEEKKEVKKLHVAALLADLTAGEEEQRVAVEKERGKIPKASRLIKKAEKKLRKLTLIQKIKAEETEKAILVEREKAKMVALAIKEKEKKEEEKEKAKEIKEKAHARENEIKRFFVLGKSYYKAGKYEEALRKFEKILFLNPEHRLTKQYITVSQKKLAQRQRAYLKAKQEAEKTAALETVASFYTEGVQNFKEGNLVRAERSFQKILILSPGSSIGKKTIRYLAEIQKIENENKREKIREEKEREKKEREFKIANHLAKGKNYYKTNQYTEAAIEFKKVLEQDSNQQEARKYLTETEYQSKRIKTVLEQAEKQLKLKNYQGALAESEKILKIKPDHERALELQRMIPQALKEMEDCFERAKDFYRNSKHEEALVLFETVLEFKPTHSKALYYAQNIKDKLEMERRAKMEAAREAREKRNEKGLRKARRYIRQKEHRLALNEVEKVLEQDPNCERAQVLYEQLYKEAGNIESQLIDLGYEEIPWAFPGNQ